MIKSMVRFGLFSAVLAVAACGGDDDGGSNTPDAGGGGDGGGGPALSGTTNELTTQGQMPLAGVTVGPMGGGTTATSGADGSFTLALTEGNQIISYSKTGFWTSLIAYTIPSAGLSGVNAFVLADGTVTLIGGVVGATVDDTKGVLFLNFPTPKAGVSVTLSSPSEGSFVYNGTVPADGATTEADTTALAHYNIAPGNITVTLNDASCRFEPAVTSFPIAAKTITTVDVICTAQ